MQGKNVLAGRLEDAQPIERHCRKGLPGCPAGPAVPPSRVPAADDNTDEAVPVHEQHSTQTSDKGTSIWCLSTKQAPLSTSAGVSEASAAVGAIGWCYTANWRRRLDRQPTGRLRQERASRRPADPSIKSRAPRTKVSFVSRPATMAAPAAAPATAPAPSAVHPLVQMLVQRFNARGGEAGSTKFVEEDWYSDDVEWLHEGVLAYPFVYVEDFSLLTEARVKEVWQHHNVDIQEGDTWVPLCGGNCKEAWAADGRRSRGWMNVSACARGCVSNGGDWFKQICVYTEWCRMTPARFNPKFKRDKARREPLWSQQADVSHGRGHSTGQCSQW